MLGVWKALKGNVTEFKIYNKHLNTYQHTWLHRSSKMSCCLSWTEHPMSKYVPSWALCYTYMYFVLWPHLRQISALDILFLWTSQNQINDFSITAVH